MSELLQPPLRLTILSSTETMAIGRARELERILDSTASGIGWDLGELENPPPGTQPLGEKLELRVFSSAPAHKAADWLDASLHSVLVVLVDSKLLEDATTLEWLQACAQHLDQQPERHRLIAVPFGEREQCRWTGTGDRFEEYQTLPWMTLDTEPGGRADQLAIRLLHGMVRVLARTAYGSPMWNLRLFISHAKLDGLYLARSLRDFFAQQSWLGSFYDARDIEPGTSWKQALREALGHSLLLVLRTDAYDRRFYCRQEVRWAEAFGVPRIVVDARSGLVHPASDLTLESASTVRIPDGNLARVLFAALQTALRSLLFQRRVYELRQKGRLPTSVEYVKILSTTPSVEALSFACKELARAPGTEQRLIIYPDPPLAEGMSAAGEAMARLVGAKLITPGQLISGGL